MARTVGPALLEILETIDRINGKLRDVTFEQFCESWELRSLAQRAVEIISEASRRIPPELQAFRLEVRWRSIAAIGNVIRHEYHAISDKLIWDVVHHELPALRIAVDAIARHVKA